jgi:bacterioferritin-associated ferredoxin
MYVCICNAVTEDDVRGCVAAGACSTREVKEACGWKPGCGSCTRKLCAVVSESRRAVAGTAAELVDALTGGPAPLAAVPDCGPCGPEILLRIEPRTDAESAA